MSFGKFSYCREHNNNIQSKLKCIHMTPFLKDPLTIFSQINTKSHSMLQEIQTKEDTGVEILVKIYRVQIN